MTSMTVDLTNCDREKIHHIAAVQGHGAFMAIARNDYKIKNVSENLAAFFGQKSDSQTYLGKRLNDLLSLDLTTKIIERLRSGAILPETLKVPSEDGMMLDVLLTPMATDLIGVEFEKSEARRPQSGLNQFLEKMQRSRDLTTVAEVACQAVRFLTDFERVMIYRFYPPTMYGEVIAEDKIASAQSFLYHRFPATDIPKPARDLYLRNKVRYIHDAAAEDFSIVPAVHDHKTPLDLSDSRIRSVSRIHLEYLKNMGVRGSMSVAIIVDGHLWGIVSCHHSTTRYVDQDTRALCLQVANTFAMAAPLMESLANVSEDNIFSTRLHDFFDKIKLEPDPISYMFRQSQDICTLFAADGVSLVTPDKVMSGGVTPRNHDVREIWETLRRHMNGELFETTQLSSLNAKFGGLKEQASGVLAIKVSPLDDSMLIFQRPEFLHTILWGGDPRKNLEARNYNGQINPRASFETWSEVVKGSSRPWKNHELTGLRNFRNLIFDSLVRKEQLIEELHHRLRTR